MSKPVYLQDMKTGRIVVYAPERVGRPAESGKIVGCPFCAGNKSMTPPVILEKTDSAGRWLIRVFPNKFPITECHEVVVHSSDHVKDVEDLPVSQVELILQAYRERFNFLKNLGQVLIFCNHGKIAGASLTHPHSQITVIPNNIDFNVLYKQPVANIIAQSKFFSAYCPEFSQWPYEVWIAPQITDGEFGNITDEQIIDLAPLWQKSLQALRAVTGEPFVYNSYIHHINDWYLRIIPRQVYRAGFELGTGLAVNTISPSIASQILQNALLTVN